MKALFKTTALTFALMSAPIWAQDYSRPPGKPGGAETEQWLSKALGTLQRLGDEEALRNLAYSYGRGNDEVTIHHGDRPKGRRLAIAEYSKGFASDVKVEVYALGGSAPIGRTMGIPAWAEFAEKFYENAKYTSTIHLMSNFSFDFTDADTAVMSAYAIAPHFIASTAKDKSAAEPTVEFMNCRYVFQARRQADGSWKTTQLRIELQEIWRGLGFYPGGQGKGL
jgi:hypothetical protein